MCVEMTSHVWASLLLLSRSVCGSKVTVCPPLSGRDQEEGARRRRGRGEHGHLSAQTSVPLQPGQTEETHSGARLQDR